MPLKTITKSLCTLAFILPHTILSMEKTNPGTSFDVDAHVRRMQEQMERAFAPMREQARNFENLVTPWAQTLQHHSENGTLTQEVLDQLKADALKEGKILDVSDIEKKLQEHEAQMKELESAREHFQATVYARIEEHIQKGTFAQQVINDIKREGESLGVPIVFQGLPDGLQG